MSGFDLDAVRAARREALGESFHFTFGGKDFAVLPAKEWPVEAVAAFSEGSLVDGVRGILADDPDGFFAEQPSMGDVEALLGAVSEWSGLGDLGN